jgi:hypothetical protein
MLRRRRRQIAILPNEGMVVSEGRKEGEAHVRPHDGGERTTKGEEGGGFKTENNCRFPCQER